MPIQNRKISNFSKKVQDLPDRPSPSYTAAQIKAQFDSSPEELRVALNGLIDDLMATAAGSSGSEQVGSAPISGVAGNTVYAQLSALKTLINAAANQNAFTTIASPGQTSVVAGAVTDTLNIKAGTGIAITTNNTTKDVTITAQGDQLPGKHASTHVTGGNDVIPNAVAGGNAGLMSGADKTKLDSALTNSGNQSVSGHVTATALNAVGTGVINMDNTSSGNPDQYFKSSGVTRGRVYFDVASGQFILRSYDAAGSSSNQITVKYADGVTPAGVLNLPGSLVWTTGSRAALYMDRSDIVGPNALLFGQIASNANRGLLWPKTGAANGSTNVSDYTNTRVDGAGVGYIGSDIMLTSANERTIYTMLAATGSAAVLTTSTTPQRIDEGYLSNTVATDKLNGRKLYFEAIVKAAPGATVGAGLMNYATSTLITGTTVSTGNQTFISLRTADISSLLAGQGSIPLSPCVYVAGGSGTVWLAGARLAIEK